jgi:hypothetical protein
MGTNDVRVETVPDPKILNSRDAIVKITSTAICGSDLHLLDGYVPTMEKGDILGHEPMQVYTALRNRNSTALSFHLASAETGDAAELVAGLGAQGKFDGGYSNLSELAVKVTEAKEGHHFYPVLFYFRFSEPHYAVSRFTLVALNSITLIKSALDDQKYEWLKESAAVAQLWRASMLLLTNLTENFLPGETGKKQPDEQARERWHRRYQDALQRFRQAGIETIADETEGFEIYVSLRVEWDKLIASLAPLLAYEV